MNKIFIIAALSCAAFAQAASPKPAPAADKNTPVISAADKNDLLLAQRQALQATASLYQLQTQYPQVFAEWQQLQKQVEAANTSYEKAVDKARADAKAPAAQWDLDPTQLAFKSKPPANPDRVQPTADKKTQENNHQ